ncbi:L,D-transpeptidase/peptidoglycan binding protein, partial [Candidatus Saccharibacteria bacterium]|nr:L,D-transpeptidase/peptidoglycan binding protein [Candidatus Saccharibacteria bacterium]
KPQKPIVKILTLSFGTAAILAIVISGLLGQFYKNKTLPNVMVTGQDVGTKNSAEIKEILKKQQTTMKITLSTESKQLTPKFEEIGYELNVDKTVSAALSAKRTDGLLAKMLFWEKTNVPAEITVNDSLLNQYIEANIPEFVKPPTDATLSFNPAKSNFSVTQQKSGEGADLMKLKADLVLTGFNLQPATLVVKTAPKGPVISEKDLEALVEPANALVKKRVVLSGLGYVYTAKSSDIASWITPTPHKSGKVQLVIDPAKIQSYVEGISKRISNAPVDTKVIKDEVTGAEVVLQEGKDGTELADKQSLSNAIASGLAAGNDVSETMNIQVAAHKTVNMSAYDKWIEVDLSQQRTTAYERATPIKTFTIASGMRGYETVKGEFAIWLRVRSQTMQGGSKADGSYYNIPNVEWVSYFYKDYALHGAWWRKVFGYPASHGCVNMTNTDAQWVYEWAPIGTKVIVHD